MFKNPKKQTNIKNIQFMSHKFYMQRCFDLARKGEGNVAPNPMVGAVIVHNGRIIGEGFHKRYGQAHAEVNAVASVQQTDRHLLSKSTIYVSLEPCCVYGNTPPCTNLILEHNIPHVVISYIDKSLGDNGKSVQLLRERGVKVTTAILEQEGKALSEIRDTYTQQRRPRIFLKYATSANGFIAKKGEQVWLSNSFSKRLVHKWRSEIDAILVGTNTLKIDNPRLTNRLYFGGQPLRIVLDRKLESTDSFYIYNDLYKSLIVTAQTSVNHVKKQVLQLDFDENLLPKLLDFLYEKKVSSLLVEGGASTLQHFIDKNLWDEARVIRSKKMIQDDGIPAPQLLAELSYSQKIDNDELLIYRNVA